MVAVVQSLVPALGIFFLLSVASCGNGFRMTRLGVAPDPTCRTCAQVIHEDERANAEKQKTDPMIAIHIGDHISRATYSYTYDGPPFAIPSGAKCSCSPFRLPLIMTFWPV